MRKRILLVIMVVTLCLSMSTIAIAATYTANCRTPRSSAAAYDAPANSLHSGVYLIEGILPEPGKNMDNTVKVEVSVHYRQKVDHQQKWTNYDAKTAYDVSSTNIVRILTPFMDEAIGARGKWSATCNVCKKSNNGSDN